MKQLFKNHVPLNTKFIFLELDPFNGDGGGDHEPERFEVRRRIKNESLKIINELIKALPNYAALYTSKMQKEVSLILSDAPSKDVFEDIQQSFEKYKNMDIKFIQQSFEYLLMKVHQWDIQSDGIVAERIFDFSKNLTLLHHNNPYKRDPGYIQNRVINFCFSLILDCDQQRTRSGEFDFEKYLQMIDSIRGHEVGGIKRYGHGPNEEREAEKDHFHDEMKYRYEDKKINPMEVTAEYALWRSGLFDPYEEL